MRAMAVEQSVGAAEILIEDEVLAQEPQRFDRGLVEFRRAGDRHPIAAQQRAHRCAGPDAGEKLVLCRREHAMFPPFCSKSYMR